MKKTILTLVALFSFTFIFTSCEKEDVIDVQELPTVSTTFLNDYFQGVKIVSVVKEKEAFEGLEYQVVLENGIEVTFDKNGKWKEVEAKVDTNAIPTSFILTSIVDYVAQNYTNVSINSIDVDKNDYEVELTNGVDLVFDLEGKFLRVDN